MDKEFSPELFRLAEGYSIDAKELVDSGIRISRDRGFGFSESDIVNGLKQFALNLINIFERIAPESGKIPNAFSTLYRTLDIKSLQGQEPREEATPPGPPFIVPHNRNPLLRHEEEWIDKIRESLSEKDQAWICQSTMLSGGGGIGKTAMALEYAYRFWKEYPGGVFWLQMEGGLGPAALSFLELADKSGVSLKGWRDQPEEILIGIMLRYLHQAPHKLIILDNLSDNTLPRDLPKKAVHLIVTTRRRSVAGLPAVEMVLPQESKALDIFLAYANLALPELSDEERNGALAICRRVERLPLALEILGQLARRQPVSSLAKMLAEKIVEIEEPTVLKEVTSVKGALMLAEQAYKHSRSREGLLVAAYLNPGSIDADNLAGILEMDKEGAVEIVNELTDFSILEKGKDAYSIHSLTQEAARGLDEDQSFGLKTAQYFNDITQSVLEKGVYRDAYHVIPHLVHLGSMAEEDLGVDEFPSSSLASRFAEYLYRAGHFSQAERNHSKCLHRTERAKGRGHLDYAKHLNNLALVVKAQGRYDEAERLFREALVIYEGTIGGDHAEYYAIHLNNLAGAVKSQGRLNEAERLHRKALEIDERTIGRDQPAYATHLNNLALVVKAQGRYDEAERLHRKVLEIDEGTIGGDHAEYAIHLNNLAGAVSEQGRYDEAERLFREVLEIDKRTIGRHHPDYAAHLNNLALVVMARGDYDEAEMLHRKVLEIDEKTLGRYHPAYAKHLNNLAGAVSEQGRYDEGESLYREALEISRKRLGNNHPLTKTIEGNCKSLLVRKGNGL